MSYHVMHWTGEMESGFPSERFGELLDELSDADAEHPDVAVAHESEWCLTVYRSGFVVLENLGVGNPVHCGPLDRAKTIALMLAVAEGRIDDVESEAWWPGYPPRR
jgi:hypothetical protein